VPFFFTAAGYFFGRAFIKGEPIGALWKRYCARIVRIFVAWSVFYYLIPGGWLDLSVQFGFFKTFYWQIRDLPKILIEVRLHPWETIFYGPTPHLWFLSALFLGISVLTVFVVFKKEYYALILGAVLFTISLLGTTYAELPVGLHYAFITRHGPYTSVLFVSLGWWLAKHPPYSTRLAWILFVVGLTMMVGVSLVISRFNHWSVIYDYLFSAVPFTVGLFMLALKYPKIGESTVFPAWGKLNLGVYAGHIFVMDTLRMFKVFFHPYLWDLVNPLAVYFMTIGLTLLLKRHPVTNKLFL
jgi:hypothetical protein